MGRVVSAAARAFLLTAFAGGASGCVRGFSLWWRLVAVGTGSRPVGLGAAARGPWSTGSVVVLRGLVALWPQTRDQPMSAKCVGRWILNTRPPGKSYKILLCCIRNG